MQSSAHTRSRLPDKSTFTSPQSSSSPANTKVSSIAAAKDAPSSSHLPPNLPIATPLTLNSSTPLALSKIEWPKDACVKWKVLRLKEDLELVDKEKEELMEGARRKIVGEWKEGILDGLVGYLRRDPNNSAPELWIFEVGDAREGGALSQFCIPELQCGSDGHFHPSWLYPCPDCVGKPHPCPKCNTNADAIPTPGMLVPRQDFRRPLWMYLTSLRDKLLDRLARLRDGCRMGDGVVYASTDRIARELDNGWQQDESSLYLLHAHIQLSLQTRCLFIHPSVRSSSLISFPVDRQMQPSPLTAVTLLPYGHPAYYLSYSHTKVAPTTLDPYLQGLGASAWRLDDRDAGWVECWILTPSTVPNTDSGFSIIWPAYLVAQDVSKDGLSPQLLPDSLRATLPERTFPATTFHPTCTLAAHLLRCSIDGPAYGFSVNVTATQTIATDEPLSAKLSPEKTTADMQLVLADSVASYEFTRSAVAARDAARTGKVNADREQERKDRDKERAEQEDQSYKCSPGQSLTAARLRWMQVPEETHIDDDDEQIEAFGLEVSVSEDLDPYLEDATMDEAGSLTAPDYDVEYHMAGTADDPIELTGGRAIDVTPEDTNMGSPRSVQSVSSISSVAQETAFKPTRPKLKLLGKSIEPLTPDGLDDEPIHEERKLSQLEPPTVITSSPPWDASTEAVNDPVSLVMPLLFSQTSSLLPTSSVSHPRAPRSDVSGDDGMDGLGLTEDDFAFYDAPSGEADILLDDPENEGDTLLAHVGPDGLLSPPAEPIQLDDVEERDREAAMAPAFVEEAIEQAELSELSAPTPAGIEEDGHSTFEPEPLTPLDGDRTPVGPLSPVLFEKLGFVDPFEPLVENNWRDSKYTLGKFAFDKGDFPPICDDLPGESCFFTWDTLSKPLIDTYNNPHVGLIRRWQGTKRGRATAFGEDEIVDSPMKRIRCSWIDVEEVKKAAEQRRQEELAMDEASDTTLDDETLVVIEEDEEGPMVSEEPTPWPAQLLWTVTVILRSFSIRGFTPALSVPAASSRRAPSPTPLSALTPVSPAAFIQMQDNFKKQEDAVNVKCVQTLENPMLAEWLLQTRIVRSDDIRWTSAFNLGKLKKIIDGTLPTPKMLTLGEALDKSDLPQADRMSGTKAKTDTALAILCRDFSVAVGLDGAVVNIYWPAIRFWDKLALYPVGGQKDVLAFAFHDKTPMTTGRRETILKSWLDAMGQAYMQMGYGKHKSGALDELDIQHGLLSGQLEDLESQLGAMLAGIHQDVPHIVVYVFCPASQLQALGNALAGSFDALSSGRMLVHLIPESSLLYASRVCFSRPSPLDVTALAVYNGLLRKVKRTTLRKMYTAQPDEKRAIQFPATTIARHPTPKVEFGLDWPPKNTDVMDPVAYLHVAYALTSEWLVTACIDQLGESHTQRVWSTKQGEKACTLEALVAKIWAFAWKFARRARKEWRIVVARWGVCPLPEIEAWQSLMKLCSALPLTISFSLLCIDSRPWQETLPNKEDWRRPPNPTSPEGHAHMVDATGTSYGICLGERFEISTSSMTIPQEVLISSAPACLELLDSSEPPKDWLRPLYTALLMQAPSDGSFTPSYNFDQPASTMTTTRVHLLYYTSLDTSRVFGSRAKFMLSLLRNYQELALLSREKWGRPVGSDILPWHLAAVVLMERVLSIH